MDSSFILSSGTAFTSAPQLRHERDRHMKIFRFEVRSVVPYCRTALWVQKDLVKKPIKAYCQHATGVSINYYYVHLLTSQNARDELSNRIATYSLVTLFSPGELPLGDIEKLAPWPARSCYELHNDIGLDHLLR